MSNNTNRRRFVAAGLCWWPGTCLSQDDCGRRSWRNALQMDASDSPSSSSSRCPASRRQEEAHVCAPKIPEKLPGWSYHKRGFWWEETCGRKWGKQACAGAGGKIMSGWRDKAHSATWLWTEESQHCSGQLPGYRHIIRRESELVKTPPCNTFIQLSFN